VSSLARSRPCSRCFETPSSLRWRWFALLSIAAFVRGFWMSDEIVLDITDHDLRTWRYGVVTTAGASA
jgi:hypothetical protein